MQGEGATVCVVEDAGSPVGLITIDDILEQVVGRIEDEYPHEAEVSLRDAVADGGAVLELAAATREQAILELAAAIPPQRLPPDVGPTDIARLALEREQEVSTDLGIGVAIPHARCPDLRAPLVVFGRSAQGIMFSSQAAERVRLLFLLVSPAEHPELQLTLLGQLAGIAETQRPGTGCVKRPRSQRSWRSSPNGRGGLLTTADQDAPPEEYQMRPRTICSAIAKYQID